ncbi:MAG: prolipoprotein diacylglyceryl transferase [Clostridia bacterium]
MQNIITFPNLGLDFAINPIAFSIGQKHIYWYGIIIACGFFFATIYAMKRSSHFGMVEDDILDTVLLAAPVSIIFARLYYVLFSLELYNSFVDIFKVWEGGLAIYGGVIGGALSFFIISKLKKVNFLSLLDIGACSILLGQAIGRWGNFINAEAYGAETTSLFMMTFGGEIGYHPTFLYESVWNFIGFLLLYIVSKYFYRFRGQMALSYLIWYGFGRGFIEGLRTDSLWLGSFRISQVLGFVTCAIASVILIYLLKKPLNILKFENAHDDSAVCDNNLQSVEQSNEIKNENLEQEEEKQDDIT